MYPKANVYYIEDSSLKGLYDIKEAHFVNINKGDYWPNMKFDKVIMNPPYKRNLHLKVLAEVLKHLSKNGKVINLSPIRWLQDPLAAEKKNSDYIKFENIRKNIVSVDVVSGEKAQELFNAGIWSDLGIYSLKYNNKDTFSEIIGLDACAKAFIKKVILNSEDNMSKHYKLPEDCNFKKPFIKVSVLHGHKGNKDFYDYTSRDIKFALDKTNLSCGMRIFEFKTKPESINFWNSLQTNFIKYIQYLIKTDMNVQWKYTPYMGDYTEPWTDERFYKYFGITKAEQKLIEDTMKEYE